jgi:N-acetylmuramoyl-L-alanine amidase
MIPLSIFCVLLMLMVRIADAGSVTVESSRVWAGPESTRIVFDVSGELRHKIFTLQNPDRLVIDLFSAKLNDKAISAEDFRNAGLKGVRHAPRHTDDHRIVIDLDKPYRPSSFQISPSHQYGHRLVIDLLQPKSETLAATTQVPSPQISVTTGQRDFIVVVDPGHGGEDPGAIGPRRTYEKNVVLAVSRQLVDELNRQKGIKAYLTRTGDYFLPLAKRTRIAREKQADLFISVHADGFKDSRVKGASVYALSQRGASSEAAKWLAQRENAADLVGGVSLVDKEDTLAYVLLDLSQSATIDDSLFFGKNILSGLKQFVPLHSQRVEQAGFMVLRSPDIPSILVELGYITNPQEEKLLLNTSHQKKLASAIANGVEQFYVARGRSRTTLVANSETGSVSASTLLAQASNSYSGQTVSDASPQQSAKPRKHKVVRGDTLDSIAKRYRVSASAIQKSNGLKGDRILAGSTLIIP